MSKRIRNLRNKNSSRTYQWNSVEDYGALVIGTEDNQYSLTSKDSLSIVIEPDEREKILKNYPPVKDLIYIATISRLDSIGFGHYDGLFIVDKRFFKLATTQEIQKAITTSSNRENLFYDMYMHLLFYKSCPWIKKTAVVLKKLGLDNNYV